MTAEEVIVQLRRYAKEERAINLARFFKTGKGEYGEGDKFLGVVVPDIRQVVRKHRKLGRKEIGELVTNKFHEVRLCGLLILIKQKDIADFYLAHTKYINNWDLVDLTAYHVDIPKAVLYKLARSRNLWERRIAIINTFKFIRGNKFEDTIRISEILLGDRHDLIHKAVGWMLREVGKRDKDTEIGFLQKYHCQMPRTMLRYAIEKFTSSERQAWLRR